MNKVARFLNEDVACELVERYRSSHSRLIILDYDGTLVPIRRADPQPDLKTLELLRSLCADRKNLVAIVSGRCKQDLEQFFGTINVFLFSDFGVRRYVDHQWTTQGGYNVDWKNDVRALLTEHISTLPKSFIEEKECALVWDYRQCDVSMRQARVNDFKNQLKEMKGRDTCLEVVDGQNAFVIRSKGSGKPSAANHLLSTASFDFIIAVGDDEFDEEMFGALPQNAVTIKVGAQSACASFFIQKQESVQPLLRRFGSC